MNANVKIQKTIICIIVLTLISFSWLSWYYETKRKILIPTYASVSIRDYAFQSGDLIICQSRRRWLSMLEGSCWGHVAIVYKDPQTHELFAWESVSTGIVLHPLYRMLDKYPTKTAVMSINKPVDMRRFSQFIKTRNDKPFAFDVGAIGFKRLFKSLLVCLPVEKRTRHSPRFCSEMAAETYKYINVLGNVSPSHILPDDFTKFQLLRNGWKLATPRWITQ
jgi:hypothetical protein